MLRALPTADATLVEMNALLAQPDGKCSEILERMEVWTQVAEASRTAPANATALHERIGRLLAICGRPDRSVEHLRSAVDLRSATSAPANDSAAPCDLTTVALAEALLVLGNSLEAEALLRNSLGPIATGAPADPPASQSIRTPAEIDAAYLLAEILRSTHRPYEALPLAEMIVAWRVAALGADADATVLARIQTARARGGLASVQDAVDELEQIHKLSRSTRGENHWLTPVAAVALGEAETRVGGRVQAGFDRLAAAAQALLTNLPPAAWHRVDGIAHSVELLESRRQWKQSEAVLRAALAALERETRPMPPSFLPRAQVSLAKNLVRQKKLDDALAFVQATTKSLQAIKQRLPDADDALADALSVSVDIARRRKQFPQAHQLCNEAQAIRTQLAAGDTHSPGVALCRVQRGWIMLGEEDFTGAEEELKEAVPLLRERLGEMDWRAGLGRLILGEARYKQVRLEEAEEDIVYGTRIVVGRRGPDEDGLHGLRLCVDLYETMGNAEMADHYRKMLPDSHDHDENDHGE